MSRKNFFLNFTDNKVTWQSNDKLKKPRPVITYFSQKLSELFFLAENIAVYKLLIKIQGSLSYVQCNHSKQATFGIRNYDADRGYCNSFRI